MSNQGDFTMAPGTSIITSVTIGPSTGAARGALSALVTIAEETTITVTAAGIVTDAGAAGLTASGLYASAVRYVKGSQGQRILALNEAFEPLAGIEVVVYNTDNGAVLSAKVTNRHGIAEFLETSEADNVDWNTAHIGFRLRVTRGAGKFGDASNNGVAHLIPLAASIDDIIQVYEVLPENITYVTGLDINGTSGVVITINLAAQFDATERAGIWHVYTTFQLTASAPD